MIGLVVVGGAVGAAIRYLGARSLDADWPHGTLLVNLVGSLVLGAVVGGDAPAAVLALVGSGFCGGLTTYSSFAVQSVQLGARPAGRARGAAYVAVTLAGCLAAAALGWGAARAIGGLF